MLSQAQIRIWLLQTYYFDKPIYNISFDLNIIGNLDVKLLDKSINILLKRVDILKTNIINDDCKPKLKFNKIKFKTRIIDNDNLDDEIFKFTNEPFDLANDLLIRVLKIKKKLIFSFSDIVIDGFSINNFFKELVFIYNSIYNRKLPKFDYYISYYDFIKKKNSQSLDSTLNFWKKILKSDCCTEFPVLINDSNDIYSSDEDRIKYSFSGKKLEEIKNFVKLKNVTLFNLFLSILYILIYKYTNEKFICLDTIMGTSNKFNQDNLIGLLNNTLLLPFNLDTNLKLDEYLDKCKKKNLSILENGEILLEKMVNNLEIKSLPNVRIHFEFSSKNSENNVKIGETIIESDFFENTSNSIRQLLMFNFGLTKNSLDCFISYKKKCFKKQHINELKSNLEKILDIFLDNKNITINEILEKLEINNNFNSKYKSKIDKRLLAYSMAGSYPNVNYYEFKKKLDDLLKK
jgi:hypothetical protein